MQRYSSGLKNSVEKAWDSLFFWNLKKKKGQLLAAAALAIQTPRCSGGSKNDCASALRCSAQRRCSACPSLPPDGIIGKGMIIHGENNELGSQLCGEIVPALRENSFSNSVTSITKRKTTTTQYMKIFLTLMFDSPWRQMNVKKCFGCSTPRVFIVLTWSVIQPWMYWCITLCRGSV